MTVRVRDAGALRVPTEMRVRMPGGTQPIERVMARTADGLSEVYRRGIRLSAVPGTVTGPSNPTRPSATETVMVSASGGTPPYTHAWTVNSPVVPTRPAEAATAFRAPANFQGTLTATDTVRDSTGLTAQVSVGVIFYEGGDVI